MKKYLILGIVALVLISLSGCQYNIFAEFDKIEIPSVADLNSKAISNPGGFVSDVEDYVENNFLDNGDLTLEQEQAVIDNLVAIYDGSITATVDVKQKAAILAGGLEINRDPETLHVVNGVIGAMTDALDSGGSLDPSTLMSSIFPSDLDMDGLKNILDDLDKAADAYAALSTTLAGHDPGLSSGEVGTMAQLAVVSLVVASIRDEISDAAILSAIQNGTSLTLTENPFDPASASKFSDEIDDILMFAGLDLGI